MKRLLTFCLSFLLLPGAFALAQAPRNPSIALFDIDIPLNPIAARYIETALSRAKEDGATVAVLQIRPQGGDAASVATMISSVERSGLPVLVRVTGGAAAGESPAGYLERAGASLVAGREAVPAPKGEALTGAKGPGDLAAYLSALNGHTAMQGGRSYLLRTEGLPIRSYPMSGLARALSVLLNPNIAYALLVLGILGIALEMSLPGVGLPGIVGGLSFLISLVALGMLSANLGGILIVVLGFVLFIIDIKAPTHGVLTAGGLVALLVGSFLLFPSWQAAALPGLSPPRISMITILVSTGLLGALFAAALSLGVRAQGRRVTVGSETLIGLTGTALTDLTPRGIVRVATEEWSAQTVGDDVHAGEEVDIVGVEGIHLIVMHRL